MTNTIRPGVVVRDRFGREGIVCEAEKPPDDAWLEEQIDAAQLRSSKVGPWWGVMAFGGGYLLCPDAELQHLRSTTYEDFMAAVEHAGIDGRKRLALLFPHYVDRVLQERERTRTTN